MELLFVTIIIIKEFTVKPKPSICVNDCWMAYYY